jgi:thiol-disulfide isomerase/thioredoxin
MGWGGREGSFVFFGVALPLGNSRSLFTPQAGTASASANTINSLKNNARTPWHPGVVPRLPSILFALAAASVLALSACGQPHKAPAQQHANALAKLKEDAAPARVPPVSFVDAQGTRHTLAEFHGRYVLLNLWATWCGPCVRELPALAHLQGALGPQRLAVVPVSVGHDSAADTVKFLKAQKADLPAYLDTGSVFLHAFGATGLPLTLLVDPKGREIARASGAVRWDAPDSIAHFRTLTAH